MRFFVDENLPPTLTGPLNALFLRHEFRSCFEEGLSGTLDLPLFETLHTRGFGAIVTKDGKQVGRNEDERRALHHHGIHWIGVPQPAASGLHLLATWNANLTAAMPHVLEKVGDSTTPPSWFSVTGIGVQPAQRFRSGLLWRASWGASPGQGCGDRTG